MTLLRPFGVANVEIAFVSNYAAKWGEGCISLATAGDRASRGFVCAAQAHSGVIKLKHTRNKNSG